MSTGGPTIGAGGGGTAGDAGTTLIAGALAATTRAIARRGQPVRRTVTALSPVLAAGGPGGVLPIPSKKKHTPAAPGSATSVEQAAPESAEARHERAYAPVARAMAAAARKRRQASDGQPDRRQRLLAVVRALGFEREFLELPCYLQDFLCLRKSPDPVLVFDASVPTDGPWRAMRRGFERTFRGLSFEPGEGRGVSVNWRDFNAFVPVLVGAVKTVPLLPINGRDPALARFCEAIGERLLAILDAAGQAAARAIYFAVGESLLPFSRVDRTLLSGSLEWEGTANGKNQVRIVVRAQRPEVREVCLDGKPRRMYRVAEAGAQINPVSWTGSDLRLKGRAADEAYAVYVQSHAMVQLYDRLDDPTSRPWLDCWLAESLARPVITERRGDDLFVEFRLCGKRVGYLVVTPVHGEKLIAVRTFLFLTMEQTPEAQRLASRLKLGRDDLDWLRLQTLSGFTRTDVGHDPAIRAKLDACGCGHLFDLRDADYAPAAGTAAELRRYLRLAA